MKERICNQSVNHRPDKENVRKTALVVIITLATMFAEIFYGIITGSMSLLADGIHMGTHTFALVVTLIAYRIAGSHSNNPDFSFLSGKVGVLGGYTNAIILGITALFMAYEGFHRLLNPVAIQFGQALVVAFIGLAVNLISALILSGGHDHHGHEHDHDHNLRAAYIHVITDAMTSVLAIAALFAGKLTGNTWPDAVVALLGALVIMKWSYGLLISSGGVLVDYYPAKDTIRMIKDLVGSFGGELEDIHIWRISENQQSLILSVKTHSEFDREKFTCKAKEIVPYSHLTLELI